MSTSIFFALRSPTLAMKAKKLLAYHKISASVVKKPSKNGCDYGISVFEKDEGNAASILKKGGLL